MKNIFEKILVVFITAILVVLFVFLPDRPSPFSKPDFSIGTFAVDRIIGGDTIVVVQEDLQTTVRLIGVNTPETSSPYRKQECYGPEATEHMSTILPIGSKMVLESDPTQDTYDKYDRLLAYVFLGEMNVNEEMIADGYAYEYTYQKPYLYQRDFKTAQKQARETNLGLWSVCK